MSTVTGAWSILGVIALTLVLVGGVVKINDHHTATAAADAAALSGAASLLAGDPEACGIAAHIAERNGGHTTSCRIEGEVIRVEVQVRTQRATAAAGPA